MEPSERLTAGADLLLSTTFVCSSLLRTVMFFLFFFFFLAKSCVVSISLSLLTRGGDVSPPSRRGGKFCSVDNSNRTWGRRQRDSRRCKLRRVATLADAHPLPTPAMERGAGPSSQFFLSLCPSVVLSFSSLPSFSFLLSYLLSFFPSFFLPSFRSIVFSFRFSVILSSFLSSFLPFFLSAFLPFCLSFTLSFFFSSFLSFFL